MIGTVKLTQRYGKRVLFDKITITLDKGKRYGLIGANGAGKSTWMKILAGELEPTDGEVQIQPGAKLGMLGQNQYAFEDFTLKDAVLYGNKRLYDAQKEKEKLYMEGILRTMRSTTVSLSSRWSARTKILRMSRTSTSRSSLPRLASPLRSTMI